MMVERDTTPRRLSSRKFLLCLLLTAMFTWLVRVDSVSDSIYMGLMMFTWGGYLTGNIAEHVAGKWNG